MTYLKEKFALTENQIEPFTSHVTGRSAMVLVSDKVYKEELEKIHKKLKLTE